MILSPSYAYVVEAKLPQLAKLKPVIIAVRETLRLSALLSV